MQIFAHLLTLCISYYAIFANTYVCGQQTNVVTLKHGGKARGTEKTITLNSATTKVNEWLGIPYAVPPVGPKRFAAPEMHPGWIGIRNFTRRPQTCWQYILGGFDASNPGARMWLNNTVMSEDCLYLNVWVPSVGSTKNLLPVMVWVYGGGFTTGSSTLEVYDGSFLAASQKVILVSMQYRLGAFGLLRAAPSDNKQDAATKGLAMGNQGLLDQALALEWTYENIKSFGGDPNAITVFGESAGAVSVSMLWLSPISRRYITRIILESGSAYTRWGFYDLEEAHQRANEFAVACGCPPPSRERDASIKCLQKVDPMTLVNKLASITTADCERRNKASSKLFSEQELLMWASSTCLYFDVPFKTVVDGYFIPKSPDDLFKDLYVKKGKQTHELIIGVNKNEAMYFLLYGLGLKNTQFLLENGTVALPDTISKAAAGKPLVPGGLPADFHEITTAEILSLDMIRKGLSTLPTWQYGLRTKSIQPTYYADPSSVELTGEQLMELIDAMAGDLDFKCPTLNFAQKFARIAGSSVYMYEFMRRTESSTFPSWTGVMHGYELEYVFGMPHSEIFQKEFYNFTSEEKKFSDDVMNMWGNFAKYGDPNGVNGGKANKIWPKFKSISNSEPNYLVLDTPMRTASGLREDQCRFWLHELPSLSKMLPTSGQDARTRSTLHLHTYIWLSALLFSIRSLST